MYSNDITEKAYNYALETKQDPNTIEKVFNTYEKLKKGGNGEEEDFLKQFLLAYTHTEKFERLNRLRPFEVERIIIG